MKYSEIPLTFCVAGEQLLGIAAIPETCGDCGLVIAVGGPQYRVGSHRQFLLLARRLAADGYPSFRFDYRGMGDSDGAMRSFEDVSDDIGAAIDAFQRQVPGTRRVVLWGLCDAASAIMIYLQDRQDERVAGVALLNPWVRSEASLAQTHIKHYYGQRLLQPEFWLKLLRGEMNILGSLRELFASAIKARQGASTETRRALTFQDRMAVGLRRFGGCVLLILSGQDFTAKEFVAFSTNDPAWFGLLEAGNVRRLELPSADHTFSSAELRAQVEDETLRWLGAIGTAGTFR